MDIPSLEEFLAFPIDRIRSVVPASLIFAAGGTRRSAALSGISRDEYAPWASQRMLATYQVFYNYGVQHLIAPATHPLMFKEKGHYGENFVTWIEQYLAGPEVLDYYCQANWTVHMVVAASSIAVDPRVKQLQKIAQFLNQATPQTSTHLWYFIVPDYDDLWRWVIEKLTTTQHPTTRQQFIQTLYGVDIPPTDLLISFGKPAVSPDILPPFLWDVIQAYWTQQPSYILNQDTLPSIFYDYAYLRKTYQIDKTGREEAALSCPELWIHGPTIGLGKRVGPYWYPQPLSVPEGATVELGRESSAES